MSANDLSRGNINYLGTRFYYEWNIDSTENKVGNESSCTSPKFSFHLRNSILEWKLQVEEHIIFLEDSELEYRKRFKIVVHLLSSEGLDSFKCSVLTEIRNADLFFCKEDRHLARGSATTVFKPGDALTILMTSEKPVTPGTKLRVFCNIEIDETKTEFKKQRCNVCDDLGSMLTQQKSCDITLKAENSEIKAHKAILAGRSPVFAAMFENDMQESNTNEVEIHDIKFKVLEEMLHYIYTGSVRNLKDVCHDLLIAADKYCMENLKMDCEKEFCKSMSTENCVQSLILADVYSSAHLITFSRNFILKNITKLISMEVWKVLEDEHPRLLATILRELVISKSTAL